MTGSEETLDPDTSSWVPSAQSDGTDFPLQNLPFGVFAAGSNDQRIGVAIGAEVLDLSVCAEADLLERIPSDALFTCVQPTLDEMMIAGRETAREVRRAVHRLLRADAKSSVREAAQRALIRRSEITMRVPAAIGNYTDFYASLDHATNVGRMFRPDNPVLPNYKHVPIGYHGRASSIVVSGTPVRRPWGQSTPEKSTAPVFAPSRSLDYEAEVGFYVAVGNDIGEPVPIARADEHIFGFCLVNDWSARDIQSWEYQPLGPFLAKSFATTVSPWVVLTDALEPFRVSAARRRGDDPAPLQYLSDERDRDRGAVAITIEVWLSSARMRQAGTAPVRLSRGNFAQMYWTAAQMLAHHTSNGCSLVAGDLLASGTVSGPTREERGCLLELTSRGAEPLELPTGERRAFLEDGDEVRLRGFCRRDGFVPIGFGECSGVVMPASKQFPL